VISKAQVMALAAGDAWLNNGANLLLFGPPGGGKSHLAAALGLALDLDTLGRCLAPNPAAIPDITVEVAPLHLYDELSTVQLVGAA
jgi:MoxR-like ATPase